MIKCFVQISAQQQSSLGIFVSTITIVFIIAVVVTTVAATIIVLRRQKCVKMRAEQCITKGIRAKINLDLTFRLFISDNVRCSAATATVTITSSKETMMQQNGAHTFISPNEAYGTHVQDPSVSPNEAYLIHVRDSSVSPYETYGTHERDPKISPNEAYGTHVQDPRVSANEAYGTHVRDPSVSSNSK